MDESNREACHDFVNKIIKLDIELASKIAGKDLQVNEVYKILNQRLSLYEKAISMPLVEADKLSLQYKKADISIELKMFRLKQELKDQINQLNSQMKRLENQIINLKEKKQ